MTAADWDEHDARPLVGVMLDRRPGDQLKQPAKAILLGRLTRIGGNPVAAELQVIEHEDEHNVGRITLQPFSNITPLNDLARAAMLDTGPTPRAALKGTD